MTAARTRRPLRVAFLGHSAKLSGAELSLVELVSALEDAEVVVILAEDGPLVDRLRETQTSVEVLPLADEARLVRREELRPDGGRLLSAGVAVAGYSARLARRLRALEVDLADANTLKALVYGAPAARLAGVPLVWHVHDRISEDYLPSLAVKGLRGIARFATAGLIANSESTLATVSGLGRPVTVVPEPIRHESFRADAGPGRDEPFTVAMVGRIAPWKGQDVFVRAFARAFRHGPERAVVFGAPLFGEHDYERALLDLIADLGLENRLELRGFTGDVAGELERVHALVHASVIPEPFGRVIVEGMAAGLPVVAAAGGGPTEIVTDGVDGILYPPGDVDELARILRRLASEPALAARLGAAAVERARAFSPEVAAAGTRAFYQAVLDRRERAAA